MRFHRDELYWSLADLNEAIRLEPTLAEAHFYRGHVQYRLLDYPGTLESYRAAVRLDPNDTDKMNQLAWVLATCPNVGIGDGKQAVELARKALALSKDEDPDLLDTLAASLAEDGRFEEAISIQDKAVNLYTSNDSGRADATKRAALYRTGQAFRWEP